MTEGLHIRLEDEQDPSVEEAVELRIRMYEFALGEFKDIADPLAETILDFLKTERDIWLELLPENHPHRALLLESNTNGNQIIGE